LVPFADAVGLADAVCAYVEQPQLLPAARAEARRIGAGLTWPSVAKATTTVLREAAAATPSGAPITLVKDHVNDELLAATARR
jgi:hypothetical protein